jgi:hypothetical protein
MKFFIEDTFTPIRGKLKGIKTNKRSTNIKHFSNVKELSSMNIINSVRITAKKTKIITKKLLTFLIIMYHNMNEPIWPPYLI